MDSPSLVESLFARRNSKTSSQYSTAKDSDDIYLIEELRVRIRIHIKALTSFGWEIRVVGNIKELGNWDLNKSQTLTTSKEKYPAWHSRIINLSVEAFPFSFEYKFMMFNPQTNECKWENFTENRTARCPERCSGNYTHEIFHNFNTYSEIELVISNKTDFAQALCRLYYLLNLEDQLFHLTELLTKEFISYNTLALASIAVKNMKKPIRNDYCVYIKFIDWCSKHLSVQHTKILLSGISPSHIWLTVCTSELNELISEYQDACENQLNDFFILRILAELRIKLLDDYKESEDITGLLLTDRFLENQELDLLAKNIEGIGENSIWKIVNIGLWITELLYLQCIKPKQTMIMINQFENLKIFENLEMLKDLLNELMSMVLEVFLELQGAVNYPECETFAAVLKCEYKPIYSKIFIVASEFLIKSLPILNKKVAGDRFICYYPGRFTGRLWVLKEDQDITSEDCILFAKYLPDDFEVPKNVKAVMVSYTDSLFSAILLQMRQLGIPICLCIESHLIEDIYTITVSDDQFSINR